MKKASFILLCVFLGSCNDIEDCQLDPYADFVGFKFTIIDEDLDFIVFDSVRLDGLGVFELDDSTSTLADTIISNLYLPIDVTSNQSTFRFFTDSIDYFITLEYKKEAYIYELDCDAGIRYQNLRITDTNLDSAIIIIDQLNLRVPENIEIFF
jgi:hypothetical protein